MFLLQRPGSDNMPGKLKLEHLCRLTSGVWPAVVGSLTHLKEQNAPVMLGNGNGANVIIWQVPIVFVVVQSCHCTSLLYCALSFHDF